MSEYLEHSDPGFTHLVADLVARLVDRPWLDVRCVVGKPTQRASAVLKKLLPGTAFERIMTKAYPLGRATR